MAHNRTRRRSKRSVRTAESSEDHTFDTVVLLGTSNTAKQVIRRNILDYTEIKPAHSTYEATCEINADWLTIIDTADPSNTNSDMENKISEYMNPSSRCHSVFLLVLQQGLVSESDINLFVYLRHKFGPEIVDKMVPVLVRGKRSSEVADDNLRRIVHACQGRLCVFNDGMDRMELIDELKKLYKLRQNEETHELRSDNHTPEEVLQSELTSSEETIAVDNGIEVNQPASPPHIRRNPRERNVMTIVLLGQAGSGKSATGNTILARRQFESHASSSAVTLECEKAEAVVCGIKVKVIDTPDFFNEDLSHPEIHVRKCRELSQPEPVVYLLVMHLGRFTDGERQNVSNIQAAFGEKVVSKTIILFTGKEKLKGRSLGDYIRVAEPQLRQLIEIFGSRYHAFNNSDKKRHQVEKLMEIIIQMQVMAKQDITELYPSYKKSKNAGCAVL